ncbi:hypothetical protein LTR85_000229 [Meristemomyces frigidus]|nr:hypothetical protein LTR85_000229 [Meristemomyces frigidus]
MADDSVHVLQHENDEMKAILRKHGLLHELSPATLARAPDGEDSLQLHSEEIGRRIEAIHPQTDSYPHEDTVHTLIADIKHLAQLPGGRPKAMRSLVDLGFTFCTALGQTEDTYDAYVWQMASRAVDDLFADLSDMVHDHYMATLAAGDDWDPAPLWRQMDDWEKGLTGWRVDTSNMAACWYLRNWHSWRVANLLSDRVSGHRLPPELVEMVRDQIYDDIDLTILPILPDD